MFGGGSLSRGDPGACPFDVRLSERWYHDVARPPLPVERRVLGIRRDHCELRLLPSGDIRELGELGNCQFGSGGE